jgi:hypothetical protein
LVPRLYIIGLKFQYFLFNWVICYVLFRRVALYIFILIYLIHLNINTRNSIKKGIRVLLSLNLIIHYCIPLIAPKDRICSYIEVLVISC